MTPSATFSPEASAEEQAALWTARVRSGPLSAVQAEELRAWLEASPVHRDLLDDCFEASAHFDAALTVALAEGALHRQEPTPARRRPVAAWAGRLAAIGLAAAVGIAFWPDAGQPYVTEPGKRASFTLEDGSRVDLSANTKLVAHLGSGERRLVLEAGEALFTVARDAARPFSVETRHGLVRVTGTIFNIRADAPEGEEVTVLEGRVLVAPGAEAEAVPLRAGEQAALYGRESVARALDADALERVTAWRNGLIIFQGESLRSALERIAWYHGRKIEISARLDGLALGGQYRLDDFDALLDDLSSVLPVLVLRAPDGRVRVVPR